MQTEDDIQRRRRMVQEAMSRGLQRPGQSLVERFQTPEQQTATSRQSFMPGESAGMPDSFWNRRFPFLRSTQQLREQQPNYAALGNNDTTPRPAVNIPPNAGLTPPEPATPNLDITGPVQPSESTSPSSKRVSFSSLGGLTGVGRLLEQRRITEAADPTSDVRIRGDNVDVTPPRMEGVNGLSRWRGLGQGLKVAAQGIDPDHPMFSLGALLGGGISGLASPRSAAKESRKLDLARLDNDIARGLKLEQEQAQLEQMRGPKMGSMSTRVVTEGEYPGIEAGTEVRTRVDPRTGEITDIIGPNQKPVIADLAKRPAQGAPHYESDSEGYLITVQGGRAQRVTDSDGQPVKVKSKNADGEVVEVTVNGQTLKVTPGQALSYYGQVGERETKRDEAQAEREARYNAAKSEYDSLVEAEKQAGAEKDRAYQVLDQMRQSSQPKEDIAQAEQDAQKANDYYRTFGEKKKDAARRMQENEVRTTPTDRAATHAFSIGAYLQRNKGATEADARAYAKQNYPGYEVVP